jgi:voltage-gated potassium channel Kch
MKRRSSWRLLEWPLVWALAAAALVLGYLGFSAYFAAAGEARSWLDRVYLSLQLFVLESGALMPPLPWQLEVARLLAPLVSVYTAGKALALVFGEQLQFLRLRIQRDHAVVCGAGRKAVCLVRELRRRGIAVVVLEENEEADTLASCRLAGARVLVGDATDPVLLRRAGVARARYVVALCGDDGANAEVAVHVRRLAAGRRGEPLRCAVHIFDPDLWRLLGAQRSAALGQDGFQLGFFNIFERGAQALLAEHSPFPPAAPGPEPAAKRLESPTMGPGTPAIGAESATSGPESPVGGPKSPVGGPESSAPPHVLIVGLGRFGQSLLIEMAGRWSGQRHGEAKLQVTVVDRAAGQKTGSLRLRCPELDTACRLMPCDMEIASAQFEGGAFLRQAELGPVTRAYVCLDDDSRCLSAALALHGYLQPESTLIVARLRQETGLASLLRDPGADPAFHNLSAFALLDRTCTFELVLGERAGF